ncbi:MAG: type II secretion system protein [Verrucomicrobia bacterium]|nr:type II secretion system protein [Verrucomicrobiota bacterium]
MQCHTTHSRRAFTLIELLVVIAIIAILVALLIPAVSRARSASKRTRAQHEVMQIVTAFKAYFDEYDSWPTGLVSGDDADPEGKPGLEMKENMPKMLRGEGDPPVALTENPKRYPFLDVPVDKDGSIVDPWGHPYKYMMDFDKDGILELQVDQFSTNLANVDVVVWSRGRDGADNNRATFVDNPKNW